MCFFYVLLNCQYVVNYHIIAIYFLSILLKSYWYIALHNHKLPCPSSWFDPPAFIHRLNSSFHALNEVRFGDCARICGSNPGYLQFFIKGAVRMFLALLSAFSLTGSLIDHYYGSETFYFIIHLSHQHDLLCQPLIKFQFLPP